MKQYIMNLYKKKQKTCIRKYGSTSYVGMGWFACTLGIGAKK
jgi:hypothetical protein